MTAPTLDTPTGRLVGTFKLLSPEWFAARAAGLGGSEVAAVLGLSPWESRFSLWHRKAGHVGAQPENSEMEWGKRLEDAVIGKFADEHPELYVLPCGTYAHVDRDWQIANPDRLAYHRELGLVSETPVAIVEAKTALYADGWGEPGTDEIPVYYRAQVLWYLDTLGIDVAYVPVLIGGHDYREYVLHADPTEAAAIRAEAETFLASIAAGERPNIDTHAATYEVVRQLNPLIDPVSVELDDGLARRYCTAKHACKAAEADVRQATSLVADRLGTAHRATFLGQTLASRQARGDGLPYLVAARKLPDFTDTPETP